MQRIPRLIAIVVSLLAASLSTQESRAASRETIENPRGFHSGGTPVASPEESRFLAALHDAKKAGDMSAARAIEEELAELRGKALAFTCADGAAGLDLRTTTPDEVYQTAGDRWLDDDILVRGWTTPDIDPVIAGDSQGNLHAALVSCDGHCIMHYYSNDGGWSWNFFSSLSHPTNQYINPSIAIGEGDEDWVLIAFQGNDENIRLLREKPDGSDFSTPMICQVPAGASNPRIVTDAAEYPGWFAYVVFNALTEDGWAVCFSRSLDFGASWLSEPDTLAMHCEDWNGAATRPDIDYGSGYLYSAFSTPVYPCSNDRREIFLTRSVTWGGSWVDVTQVTANGNLDFLPTIGAIKDFTSARTVVLAYCRLDDALHYDVRYSYSQNGGDSWSPSECLSCNRPDEEVAPDIETSFSQGAFHLAYWHDFGIDYATADYTEPWVWAKQEHINFGDHATQHHPWPNVAVNPTRPMSEEAGVVWTDDRDEASLSYDIYFDAIGLDQSDLVEDRVPAVSLLSPSMPNPFGDHTTIQFELAEEAATKLVVCDVTGRTVRQLVDGMQIVGRHTMTWDGNDEDGERVGTGIYFLHLKAGDVVSTRTVAVLR